LIHKEKMMHMTDNSKSPARRSQTKRSPLTPSVFYQAWRKGTNAYLGDHDTLRGLITHLQGQGCAPQEVTIQGCVLRPAGQPQGYFSMPPQYYAEHCGTTLCWCEAANIRDYAPDVPNILAVQAEETPTRHSPQGSSARPDQ
jgi:hypothetical protein